MQRAGGLAVVLTLGHDVAIDHGDHCAQVWMHVVIVAGQHRLARSCRVGATVADSAVRAAVGLAPPD
jgi:hypothetical protein